MTTRRTLAALWVAAFGIFVATGVLAGAYDTFPGDVWLAQRIQDIDSDGIERTLDWAEDAADIPMVALVSTTTTFLLLLARDGRGGLLVWAAVLTRVLTTWGAKELIQRPRPSANLLDFTSQPDSFSFPSGHAAAAFVLYGLIFYFAALHITNPVLRSAVQAICVLLIIGAGVERIFVGHHWPSDVLGGYFHGALIVSAAIALHHLVARLKPGSNLQPSSSFSRAAPNPDQGLGRARET